MIIFDPLSVIIKLGILSKKPIGTKLSIKNFIITIQEPNLYQGIIRYLNDDNKLDIANLLYPIKLACESYLDNIYKIFPNIKILFRNAQNGINILINQYNKYPIVIYTLKYANLIIDNYINNLSRNEIIFKYNSNISKLHNQILNNKSLSRNSSTNNLNQVFSRNTTINEDKIHNSKNYIQSIYSPKSLSRNSSTNDLNQDFSRKTTINEDKIHNHKNYKQSIYSPKSLSKNSSQNNFKSLSRNSSQNNINEYEYELNSEYVSQKSYEFLNDYNNARHDLKNLDNSESTSKNLSRNASQKNLFTDDDFKSSKIINGKYAMNNFFRKSSLIEKDLYDNNKIILNNNTKLYRFGATGFLKLDVNNDDDINYLYDKLDNNINNFDIWYYEIIKNNLLIFDNNNYSEILLKYFDDFWTIEKINLIISLMENYINGYCLGEKISLNSKIIPNKTNIENYMDHIDDIIVNIILDFNYHENNKNNDNNNILYVE